MKLLKQIGCYEPGFYRMGLNYNDEIPAINQMEDSLFTIFLHEYVHYIQDITTTYGLNNSYCYSEYLRSVIKRIRESGLNEFKVPFDITDDVDCVLTNLEIRKFTMGDSNEVSQFDVQDVHVDVSSIEQVKFARDITIESTTGDLVTFGAIAIMESMAYLLEKTCAYQIASPDFPYAIAQKVAIYYDEPFGQDDLNVITLCDMSLMCVNPGSAFIYFLDMVSSKNVIVDSHESIVDFFYNEIFEKNDGSQTTLMDTYKELSDINVKSITTYVQYKGPNSELEQLNLYLKTIYTNAMQLRVDDKYFIIKLARSGRGSTNKSLGYIVSKFGVPLIFNSKDEAFIFDPLNLGGVSELQFFCAISQIEQLFREGQTYCKLEKWCENSPKSTPDSYCNSSPWEKVKDPYLCPYAFLWKHWGLSNYKPLH